MKSLSISMFMMYVSFAGMFLLILAMGLIVWSRSKLRGWVQVVVSLLAYLCLICGGFIILYVVFSGPTR
ncbi:DUF2768 domain-containing protein [Oceanobacillus kimchii]|uniref:DUF2768 domain-containing protein n=2 Tax=Oceanobacillus kimchii TaxID=746691 RepID=UPI0035CD00B5